MRGITRKYRNITILALFQVVHLIPAAAQFPQLHFENITTDDGLSNNVVTCLYQDKKGFLLPKESSVQVDAGLDLRSQMVLQVR